MGAGNIHQAAAMVLTALEEGSSPAVVVEAVHQKTRKNTEKPEKLELSR
jgi:hypothetical protein